MPSNVYVGTSDAEQMNALVNDTFGRLSDPAATVEDGRVIATGLNENGLNVRRVMRVTDGGYMATFAEGLVRA